MPNIFDTFDYNFWNQGFDYEESTSQALQKLLSLNNQQKEEFKHAYEENPFLFLRFNNKMLDELKKLGIDMVVDQNDQNRIFAITDEGLMKQYDEIFSLLKSYFDHVTGDGYCQTYATMQAFGWKKEDVTQANAKKIRQEIAEASALKIFQSSRFKKKGFDFKSFDQIPKNILEENLDYLIEYKELMGLDGTIWCCSAPVVQYFSEKNKRPAWDIATGSVPNSILFNTFNGANFQDILYGCPVVVLNGGAHNHTINLKADRTERKKFVLEFYNLFRDTYIAFVFCEYFLTYNGANHVKNGLGLEVGFNFKSNFYEVMLPGLLSCLFKKIDKQEVITQLENFFNCVPHNYKNMIAIKLVFYIFDKYKTKILEPFDINTPESEFTSANKFLSDVLGDLKKDLMIKYPDLEKVLNYEGEEKPGGNETEPEKTPESERISDNREPEPITNRTTQKLKTNELQNDQQLYKPKENNKKDGFKTKDKPKSKKKIFSGSKGLYIFLCIITLGILSLFISAPKTEKDEPSPEKYKLDNTQSKNNDDKVNKGENPWLSKSKLNAKKTLSNLSSVNSQIEIDAKEDLTDRKSI